MRIFIITATYPTNFNKQAGSFIQDQCKALSEKGHEIIVLAAIGLRWKTWNKDVCDVIDYYDEDKVKVYRTLFRSIAQSRLPRLCKFSFNNRINKLYMKAISDVGKPDILYAHFSFPAGYGAALLSKREDIPLIVLEHHSLYLKPALRKEVKRMLVNTIDTSKEFICVSKALKLSIQKITNTKKSISIIPNMLDESFSFFQKEKKDSFYFFGAGNLVKGKAFDLLIMAFSMAFKENENVKLVIAGGGPERNKLAKLISKYGRNHQIELLDRITRTEMLSNYQNCNCFVLPSRRETFGIVYREAMAVGRPVISTRNGGIEEGWKDVYGILTEIDNVSELTHALQYMRDNIDVYDGKYISECMLKDYSTKIITSKINNKLRKVCNFIKEE